MRAENEAMAYHLLLGNMRKITGLLPLQCPSFFPCPRANQKLDKQGNLVAETDML